MGNIALAENKKILYKNTHEADVTTPKQVRSMPR
jgi:hypothetical protein